MNDFTRMTCGDFTAELAAKTPVPGGGGVSALVGALGASLCTMAGNHTTGKKKYAGYEADLRRMIAEGEEIRLALLDCINADAEAFEPLQKAYSIPKDDPSRTGTLEKVSLDACGPAITMMHLICRSIELMEEMLVKGSVLMVSDVGCGANFAAAALKSASLNIFINTRDLTCGKARELEQEADSMLAEYLPRAEAVSDEVMNRLRDR